MTALRDDQSIVLPTPAWMANARRRVGSLSSREHDVFLLLAQGLDNRGIARRLGLAERTTKRHVSQVLAKLSCQSRLQAGLVAMVDSLSRTEGVLAASPAHD